MKKIFKHLEINGDLIVLIVIVVSTIFFFRKLIEIFQ